MKSIDLIENRIGKAGQLMKLNRGGWVNNYFLYPKHNLFNPHGYTQNTSNWISRTKAAGRNNVFFFNECWNMRFLLMTARDGVKRHGWGTEM